MRVVKCRCDGRYEGCDHPAGTWSQPCETCKRPGGSTHSPVFCQPCDNHRRAHISVQFADLLARAREES